MGRSDGYGRIMERIDATAEQARAIASPVRLRILRLCHDDELTNRELAELLDRDPSTILHHTRLLVDAGMLEQADERPGPRGSTEKPYRATGLSWRLDFAAPTGSAEHAAIDAVREELAAAGPGAVRSSTRAVLHLDDDQVGELAEELLAVVERWFDDDRGRKEDGLPSIGLYVLVHDLARTPGARGRRGG